VLTDESLKPMEKFSYKYNLECCQQFAMSEILSPAHYAIFPRTHQCSFIPSLKIEICLA